VLVAILKERSDLTVLQEYRAPVKQDLTKSIEKIVPFEILRLHRRLFRYLPHPGGHGVVGCLTHDSAGAAAAGG